MVDWLLTLFLGTSATFTSAPIDMPIGETFLLAPHALKPVSNAMRVDIGLGKSTVETKKAVLSGSLKLSDFGHIGVAVCRSKSDCIELQEAGTYFSEKTYGIGFEGTGQQFKASRFIGVKISCDRPLTKVVISWSNFSE